MKGLVDEVFHAYLQASLLCFLTSITCQGNDVAVVFLACIFGKLQYLLAGLKTIHFRHLKVHEDELVRSILALTGLVEALFEHFHSLYSVTSLFCFYLKDLVDQNL